METRVWLNRGQPQPLTSATLLLYFTAFFAFLFSGLDVVSLFITGGGVAAGYGIANHKKWGVAVGAAVAILSIIRVVGILDFGQPFSGGIISLMFDALLLYLLFSEESRDYQRIWFK